ncbi:Protein unc-80 [Aphelenchoides fujianensis]|nr:Protein unc-80 [Aphelenchoides fujianensis]
MFVYVITPLCHVVKEEEIENHIRLESGLRLWQALWQASGGFFDKFKFVVLQFRQPELLCFSAPVKQRRNQLPQLTVSRRAPVITATEQGIYLGDEPVPSTNRRSSQSPATQPSSIAPSAKLSMGADSSSSKDTPSKRAFTAVPIPEQSPSMERGETIEFHPPDPAVQQPSTSHAALPPRPTQAPTSGIVRSVSDYKTSELAGDLQNRMSLRKSRTDVFYQSPDSDPFSGMKDIDEAMRFAEDTGSFSEIFQFNDRAPLVQLQEICSAASIDASDTFNGEIRHESKPCTACKRFPCSAHRPSIHSIRVPQPLAKTRSCAKTSPPEDTSSITSQQTVINRAAKIHPTPLLQLDDSKKDSVATDPHEATYLDVATMRCLLIRNWSEDGVYWVVKYILNRLTDIRQYRCSHEGPFRSRSNSVPTVAAVRGSRHDVLNAEYLTWADLQERSSALDRRTCGLEAEKTAAPPEDEGAKTRVAFNIERAPGGDSGKKLKVVADQRRISVNTLPATKKLSRAFGVRRAMRSKSEPAMYQPAEFVDPASSAAMPPMPNAESDREAKRANLASQFFPEAIGSSMFIEKNGHLSLSVVLKTLGALIERCSAIRIMELVLNACDTLLTTPNCETLTFFEGIVKICIKTYIHLGCPNGCNEGMRTPQADFMRIKLKNLFSQMHKLGQPALTEILRSQVIETGVQSLLDCLHSMTAFCDLDAGKSKTSRAGQNAASRRRSSTIDTRMPSYRNNFNENQAGMEGDHPEHAVESIGQQADEPSARLGLYQDVRMLIAYVYEYHGNPLRRTALSALASRLGAEDGEHGSDSRSNSETTSTRFGAEGSLSSNQRDNASLRRGLFKKKGDKFATVNADDSEIESSPSTPRNSSNRNDAMEDENWEESVNLDESAALDENGASSGLNTESRSRISFRNAAQKVNYCRQRQSLSIDNSYSDLQTADKPPAPVDVPFLQLYLPPRRLVNILDAREGARRFSFLLETCKPGQLPDAPLIAALLELASNYRISPCSLSNKSPVLSRAIILLECANFVHRCNHGNWPDTLGSVRNPNTSSFTSGPNRMVVGGSRKTFMLQRSAGRSFYDWAIQISARIQKMTERDEAKPKEAENKKRLKLLDDIEDFLDDGTVNDQNNEHCPPALQLMACQLLCQITAFLRETFQLIPRSKIAHKTAGSSSGWEKLMSHRRWSILSNTFNNQTGSIHSINDLHPAYGPERRVSYSTADEESSPRGSHDLADDQPLVGDKKVPLNSKTRDSLKPGTSAKNSTVQEDLTASFDTHTSPERRTGTNSVSGSHHGPHPPPNAPQLPHTAEDDEEEMLKNMPWIKVDSNLSINFNRLKFQVMITMMKQFDVNCTHEKNCTQWCFDRVYRQCKRLTDAFPRRLRRHRPDRERRPIDGSCFPTDGKRCRRRTQSAIVRQAGMERVPVGLARTFLIEKLSEIEETKSTKKESNNVVETAAVDLTELSVKKHPILNYIRNRVFNLVHAPLSSMLKSAVIMTTDQYRAVVGISWSLLIHADANTVSTAAAMFICCSVKGADDCVETIKKDLSHNDASVRSAAVRRFYALWRNRFHVWLKMEDGAQMIFKVPPPGIDFTLPSPPIGQSQQPVVDPPWMPHVKTKVEELSLKEEEHSTSQTIMTMTRTRRKQKQEMVKKAVREAEERQYELRQHFPLRATAVVQQAAYEPALFQHQAINLAQQQQQQQNADGFGDDYEMVHSVVPARQQMPVAQPLFPSAILSVVPQIVEMFDDVQVDRDGCSVGDVCKRTAWSCIIEDSSLFLRHFLEKLTHRDKQEYLQTAYSLLNYLFGFVMFYVRTPCEGSDKSMGLALSVIWLVTPYVHGLYFKDLKQTLKKEQCDQALMITANVPSAKKIIVHGPDSGSGGIPSQFPIHEDTQFQQILTDSLDFFNIPEEELDHYFLIDSKTGLIHNPTAYVRDFYFFHRSFYPQLTLAKMDPNAALLKMKTYAFQQKLIETGKVLLTHNALRYSPGERVGFVQIPQRIFFLHDEFTHLPSFPRRSVESCFGMYQGPMGTELQAVDAMHKFVWSKLVSDMFEKMENAFMFGDLHLFINVINGIVIIHCEDVLIIRRCMATYITMAIHFSTLFASNGFFLIMPTLLRCYSQRQTNKLFKQVIDFTSSTGSPSLLQMFGSIADICDQNNNDLEINAMQVKAKYLFNLLLAMEVMNDLTDQLDILTLVPYPKPLKALDLCYRDDPNSFLLLPDAMASCVTVCAFSPESKRSHQMLLVMQAILPHFITHQESETSRQNNSGAAIKHEITCYTTMCVEMKALVNSCETLSRGPTRTFDIVNSVNDRGKSFIADSPQFFDPPTVADDEPKPNATSKEKKAVLSARCSAGPEDAFLLLCALFIEKAGARLKELTKLAVNVEHTKIPEIFDHKCHVKISEVALSLLKVAPYDLTAMGCQGLQKYFTCILPIVDWSVETNRSALSVILRRLDKTISKIAKKPSVRKRANWTAIGNWLNGLYQTLSAYPYIAHLHPLKTITQTCLRMTVGDHCTDEVVSSVYTSSNPSTILNASVPPQAFCNIMVFSLEIVCSQEGVGAAAERLEAVLCHILIPIFLMAAVPGKEAPQFQAKDLSYCLTLMYNTVCPPLAKQSLAPTTPGTLANSRCKWPPGLRFGDGSRTQRHGLHPPDYSGFRPCTMKAMILAFHRQMTGHWVKFGKIAKEMISKRLGGTALFSFVEFLLSVNLPISLIVYPVVQNKLNQKPNSEQEAHWFNELRERVTAVKQTNCDNIKGYNTLLSKLQHELQQMRDDFSSRTLDIPRSHTPTIGDLHSDSGSTQSVSTHRSSRQAGAPTESRRLSSSTAFAKLRGAKGSVTSGGPGSVTSTDVAGHNLHDATILEDIEDETTQMITGKVTKSPSLPSNRAAQSRTRSITGLGMFRSVRRKSRPFNDDEEGQAENRQFEMRDIHRRTKSWNKRLTARNSMQTKDTVLITPLTMPESQLRAEPSTPTSKTSECQQSVVSGGDRPRMVSFSTPKHSRNSQAASDTDSEEFYITAKHHLI